MPKLVSEMSLVLKIANTYVTNYSKIQLLKELESNDLTKSKINILTLKNLQATKRLNIELDKFKEKLSKEQKTITITFTKKDNQLTNKLYKLENPKVDFKYCEILGVNLLGYIKRGLFMGELKSVKIEVLK